MMSQPPIISLKSVTFGYPDVRSLALDGVSLEVAAGEFVAVAGANGSGKSTLARLFNGLLLPGAGNVLIDGKNTKDRENLNHIRETVAMVFQNPESQIVAATVGDDIAFGLENLGLPAEQIGLRVQAAARRFGLAGLLDREPHWLSGGQKQRTVLAGAVAMEPRVLVLDEPASMLDPCSRKEFMALVRDLWQDGTTVVYLSHDMDEVARAPRMIALSEGKVSFDGDPHDFFSREGLMAEANLRPPLAVRLSRFLASAGSKPPALTLAELVKRACA